MRLTSLLRHVVPLTLVTVLCTGLSVVPTGRVDAHAADSSSALSTDVERLRAQVAEVADRLAAGTSGYEEAVGRHERLTQLQWAAEEALEQAQSRGVSTRGRLDAVARAAYIGQVPPEITALLSGDPRALGDLVRVRQALGRVSAAGQTVISDAAGQEQGIERLVVERDRLRREALADKQSLDGQLEALRAESAALTAQLQATAERLRRAQDDERRRAQQEALRRAAARAAAAPLRGAGLPVDDGTGRCLPARSAGVNGFLGPDDLCTLTADTKHRLRTDAARAFDALNQLRLSQGGAALCVSDSYRSYPEQVDVFARKPGLAAVPGRSNHGWGLALDLGCGAQSFGSDVDRWLQSNAAAFGWDRPDWADPSGSKPEPWHYEYIG